MSLGLSGTKKEFLLLFCIFIVALNFRLFITGLVPQPVVYDQLQYEEYARKIYDSPSMLASHTYRSYPLPLLLAAIYKLSYFGNHQAVYFVHAIIDSLTALIIFWILKMVTRKKNIAVVGALLFAINPFTAGYVGTVSSEVLTIFFVAASMLSGIFFIKKPTIINGLLVGFSAGMAAETRNAMTIGSLILVVSLFFWIDWKSHKRAFIGLLIGGFLTLVYPLYTNWRDYHQITPFKVDSFYAMEFYNGATINILPPFATTENYPLAQQIMWGEYYSEYYPQRTQADRRAMAGKYLRRGWEIVKENPLSYVRWRLFKLWYVWQKENIYPIVEPGFAIHRGYIFWGNTLLLGFAVLGILRVQRKTKLMRWFWIVAVSILASQTIAFAFSHAEYRLTLPLYPIVIMFAALGLMGEKLRDRSS